ncbi:amidohydrolase family protein [Mycobacterium sp. 2YAF39]|uniref:amidohydrolase family protein n=1 Tax=Mycobacterium sp. 2YAF39 TaxID=3233033 RepID=UPI003F9C4676
MRKWLVLSATTATIVTAAAWAGPALADAGCFDRKTQPYTSVVDSHLHPRPFGGPGIPLTELGGYWRETGVRFVNLYGIGQILPEGSSCTYYLACLGTPVLPSPKNDIENAQDVARTPIDGVHLTLSMTFPDLANPAGILDQMRQLDAAFPGEFTWMGEVNLIKQALWGNAARPAGIEDIVAWRPFMDELRRRGMPITIHSDLGNEVEPLKYLYLMEAALNLYPANKIVWPHMGLSNELTTMDPRLHIDTLRRLMDQHPNLYLDISWRILEDSYFSNESIRDQYVPFFDQYSSRIIPGTDFVASRNKDFSVYEQELDVTSQINKYLSDNAFRDIALGQSYFTLLGLPDQAPPICAA